MEDENKTQIANRWILEPHWPIKNPNAKEWLEGGINDEKFKRMYLGYPDEYQSYLTPPAVEPWQLSIIIDKINMLLNKFATTFNCDPRNNCSLFIPYDLQYLMLGYMTGTQSPAATQSGSAVRGSYLERALPGQVNYFQGIPCFPNYTLELRVMHNDSPMTRKGGRPITMSFDLQPVLAEAKIAIP